MGGSFAGMDAAVLNCPSCRRNLRNMYCAMNCDPNQSRFITAKATEEYVDDPESTELHSLISAINFYISDSYVKDTFESCKDVKGMMGKSALYWMCSLFPGTDCSDPYTYNAKLSD